MRLLYIDYLSQKILLQRKNRFDYMVSEFLSTK